MLRVSEQWHDVLLSIFFFFFVLFSHLLQLCYSVLNDRQRLTDGVGQTLEFSQTRCAKNKERGEGRGGSGLFVLLSAVLGSSWLIYDDI